MSPSLSALDKEDKGKKGRVKVLIAAGASGGHIFPALSLADGIKPEAEVALVVPKKNALGREAFKGYAVNYVSIVSIKLQFSRAALSSWINFIKGSFESLFIIARFKPDAVVGFGSLVCVPLLLFAWLFRIETLIHEQNVVPGRANRFLSFFVDKIAVSFRESEKYLPGHRDKIVLTGNPLRKDLCRVSREKALEFFAFKKDKFTVLVMGGSQGSHSINSFFLKAASQTAYKNELQVIHLAGAGDKESLENEYRNLGICVRVFDFFTAMQYAYCACDLVLSRAGATTISEVIYYGIPAVFVPYPYAHAHQLQNARILEDHGCAVIISEEELKVKNSAQVLEGLFVHSGELSRMRQNYQKIKIPAAEALLCRAVLRLVRYG